jgi:hypothetical protein
MAWGSSDNLEVQHHPCWVMIAAIAPVSRPPLDERPDLTGGERRAQPDLIEQIIAKIRPSRDCPGWQSPEPPTSYNCLAAEAFLIPFLRIPPP